MKIARPATYIVKGERVKLSLNVAKGHFFDIDTEKTIS